MEGMGCNGADRAWLRLMGAALPLAAMAVAVAAPGGAIGPDRKPLAPPRTAPTPDAFFLSQVEPLLDKTCLKCHAGVKQSGGLDLRSLETMLRGGDSGPALIPGDPDNSLVVQVVSPSSGPHMPPDPKKHWSKESVEILRRWIALLPKAPGLPRSGLAVQAYLEQVRKANATHPEPPVGRSLGATVDWFLEIGRRKAGVVGSGRADDAVLVRRLTLDLLGRIPTPAERDRYVRDSDPRKYRALVDTLLSSPEHARHMREVFDTLLMGRTSPQGLGRRRDRSWHAFLEDAFLRNRPWNAVVYDLLVARASEGPRAGASWFLAERNNAHQSMAEAVAPVVYGVKIGCAQCHNHPLAWEIEQRHYWGLVAAFNRSKNIDTDAGPAVAESAVGGFINFANLKKESQPAKLVFLNGAMVAETPPAEGVKESDDPALYVVPPAADGKRVASVPRFSRREAFARTATTDNPLLARAMVNRIWALFLGRGLVHPVDEIDSKHRPSHPELLEWLARDFERSGYDVRRLIRGLLLSETYRMGTRPVGDRPPRPETFARMVERPLTAEQVSRSVRVALGGDPAQQGDAEWEHAVMASHPDVMPNTVNPPLALALALTNGKAFDSLLRPAPGNTSRRLLDLTDPKARVHAAFALVLGRSPAADEMAACLRLLSTATPEAGVRDLLWALLTSAEFMVNH